MIESLLYVFCFCFQLQTFELEAPHRTAEEISDGVAMAQALSQM